MRPAMASVTDATGICIRASELTDATEPTTSRRLTAA